MVRLALFSFATVMTSIGPALTTRDPPQTSRADVFPTSLVPSRVTGVSQERQVPEPLSS